MSNQLHRKLRSLNYMEVLARKLFLEQKEPISESISKYSFFINSISMQNSVLKKNMPEF